MADVQARVQQALAGHYVIEREIGRGGMATVYLAADVKHLRRVAIKVLDPDVAQAVGPERFLREVETAARLSHPHIVPLFDSGETGGCFFYAMPYVEGESLRQRMDRDHQLPVEEALGIARQVASALDYAHAHGVIHRDIKPENILLHHGEALVADFGIALVARAADDHRLTGTGVILGTPTYMSVEHALGEAIDARSDQYSLACVLFEMLAGEPPYTGSAQSVLTQRLTAPVPSVRRLRGDVPAAVDAALARALAREPAGRFASTAAFAAALSAPATPRVPTVAVLPFHNFSADPENAFFADGITEDVIAHLSKIASLRVISRTSVMPFRERQAGTREIAGILGATALVEGSVRRSGDRVRIVAQLIEAASDQHLWAETYDRELTDIFAIQTDVALQIAAALRTELSPAEHGRVQKRATTSVEAYQLFLEGQQWLIRYDPDALQRAIACFDRALERDPDFALAAASAGMAYIELGEHGALPPDVAHSHAAAAVATAMRSDPELGAAFTTRAHLKMVFAFDWAGAERDFRQALELSPNSADAWDLYGRLCSALERWDEAITRLQRARELDPLAHRSDLATALLRAGRHAEAVALAERAVALDPAHSRLLATLGWGYILTGRHAEGVAALERAVANAPGTLLWLAQLGQAYGLTGDLARADDVRRQLETCAREAYVSPYHLAYVYTGLGDAERAIALLERAVQERAGSAYGIRGSFLFRPLRGHPRYEALLQRMGLR